MKVNSQQRAVGSLLGLACGDAVGTTVEFRKRGSFPPVVDMVGGGKFRLNPGEWTDDTSMALCLADSLIACDGFDANDQMERYWQWANEGYNSCRPHVIGMGKTVLKALSRYRKSGDPYSGDTDPKSSGNGSLMRIAPIAIAYYKDPLKAIEYAELSSKTTHASVDSIASCQYFVSLLVAIFQGESDKFKILDKAKNIQLPKSMKCIKDQDFLTKSIDDISGSGYVVESLEAALWCFYSTDNFKDAILSAVNLGDDADTTAAICGQIAGAFYGVNAIPGEWRKKLFRSSDIESLALTLHQINMR